MDSFLHEIHHGHSLAKQLRADLDGSPPLFHCKPILQEILSTFEKLWSMAQEISPIQPQSPSPGIIKPEPTAWPADSPQISTPRKPQLHRKSPKKRKVLATWTTHVCSPPSSGLDVADGYNWRKYGQKKILGAINPRAYFRCTHRFTRRCEALKIVQRSDDDQSVLEITYKGEHTCCLRSAVEGPPRTGRKVETEDMGCLRQAPELTQESQLTGGSGFSPCGSPVSPFSADCCWRIEENDDEHSPEDLRYMIGSPEPPPDFESFFD